MYQTEGKLPELTLGLQSDNIIIYGEIEANTPAEALQNFLNQPQDRAYISLPLYVRTLGAVSLSSTGSEYCQERVSKLNWVNTN